MCLNIQPREQGYRVELVHEVEGWLDRSRVQVPTWRLGRATTLEAAAAPHYAHLAQAYRFPGWEARSDVPAWAQRRAHGPPPHRTGASGRPVPLRGRRGPQGPDRRAAD